MATNNDLSKVRLTEQVAAGRVFHDVNDVSGDVNTTEDSYVQFGLNENKQDQSTEDGSTTWSVVGYKGQLKFARAGIGYNPDTVVTGLRIDPDDSIPLPLWTRQMDKDLAKYVRSVWKGIWQPGLHPEETNDPDRASVGRFSGRHSYPITYDNCFIYGEKIGMTGTDMTTAHTGTMAVGAFATPNYTGGGILAVIAMSGADTTSLVEVYPYQVSAGIVTTLAVALSVAQVKMAPSHWTKITHAYVVKIGTGAGTHPKGTLPVTEHTYWSSV